MNRIYRDFSNRRNHSLSSGFGGRSNGRGRGGRGGGGRGGGYQGGRSNGYQGRGSGGGDFYNTSVVQEGEQPFYGICVHHARDGNCRFADSCRYDKLQLSES